MEKRYQVFVSSTYQDLIVERIEVIQALLELDCIPVGMEYFPAADDTQWDFIKKLIDESDYYVVIIAGMYGSEDENGISYTQKEYEYAISKGIPIISFIQKNVEELPSSKTEKEFEKIKKLESFKENAKKKLCKFYITHQELGAVVSRSISQAKKNYPRTGWIRADSVSETSEKEIVQLYKKIENLEKQLNEKPNFYKTEIDNLSQGDEEIENFINLSYGWYNDLKTERKKIKITWNQIAYYSFPKLIENNTTENVFKSSISSCLREHYLNLNLDQKINGNLRIAVSNDFYQTIKLQFQLLGMITFYEQEIIKEEKIKLIKTVTLTDKGKEKLINLRAILKK